MRPAGVGCECSNSKRLPPSHCCAAVRPRAVLASELQGSRKRGNARGARRVEVVGCQAQPCYSAEQRVETDRRWPASNLHIRIVVRDSLGAGKLAQATLQAIEFKSADGIGAEIGRAHV